MCNHSQYSRQVVHHLVTKRERVFLRERVWQERLAHNWIISGEEMKETGVDSPQLLRIFLQRQVLQENWNHLQEEEIEREREVVRKREGVC